MSPKRQSLMRRVAALPEELLDEVEQSVDDLLILHEGVYRLSDDERAAVRRGIEAAKRGEFVSDEEMAAFCKQLQE
jgi:predicted transcriptional regulator